LLKRNVITRRGSGVKKVARGELLVNHVRQANARFSTRPDLSAPSARNYPGSYSRRSTSGYLLRSRKSPDSKLDVLYIAN